MTEPGPRPALSTALTSTRLVVVLRAPSAAAYLPVVRTLAEAGVRSIELTLTTPGTIDILADVRAVVPLGTELGVGTVLDPVDAHAAIDAGADFLVTPTTTPAVIEAVLNRGVPIYPGGLSPTEMHTAWSLGVPAVKLFPASAVGPDYLRNLHGPFPQLAVIPSGGIDLDDAGAWLAAGAVAVSIGSPVIGSVFSDGDLVALSDRVARLLHSVETHVGAA